METDSEVVGCHFSALEINFTIASARALSVLVNMVRRTPVYPYLSDALVASKEFGWSSEDNKLDGLQLVDRSSSRASTLPPRTSTVQSRIEDVPPYHTPNSFTGGWVELLA